MHSERIPLVTGQVYHIYSKSIAGYKIFCNNADYSRMISACQYYNIKGNDKPLSKVIRDSKSKGYIGLEQNGQGVIGQAENALIEMIAHCLMPTHIHFILKQKIDEGIPDFMEKVMNSYARYFNTRYGRKGPLWEGRYGRRLIESDGDLLHMTRYLHLNPVTACLINKPEEWEFSSYNEYLKNAPEDGGICNYQDILDISPLEYKRFVEDRAGYQRELGRIKHLLFD